MKSWAKFFCSVCWLTTFLLFASGFGSIAFGKGSRKAAQSTASSAAADGPRSLYERLGGDFAIRAVVDDFYEVAREDALLGPVFEKHVDDWPAHLNKMYGFWGTALLGAQTYFGNPFEKHRVLPELSGDHFARWLDLFAETLRRHCSPSDATAWEAMVRRMGFAMTYRLGFGERADLLP